MLNGKKTTSAGLRRQCFAQAKTFLNREKKKKVSKIRDLTSSIMIGKFIFDRCPGDEENL